MSSEFVPNAFRMNCSPAIICLNSNFSMTLEKHHVRGSSHAPLISCKPAPAPDPAPLNRLQRPVAVRLQSYIVPVRSDVLQLPYSRPFRSARARRRPRELRCPRRLPLRLDKSSRQGRAAVPQQNAMLYIPATPSDSYSAVRRWSPTF